MPDRAATSDIVPPVGSEILIEDAVPADAAAILALQRLCYQTEARRYRDWSIPPLTETLPELRAELATSVVLAARLGERVIGSVRAREEGDCVSIGRLIVHPEFQRRGLGTALMAAIEWRFGPPACFELFTGHRSDGNLQFYRRLGYVEHRREPVSDALCLVYLRKRVA
jgi:GNAT superfamily N-acetyltransferase